MPHNLWYFCRCEKCGTEFACNPELLTLEHAEEWACNYGPFCPMCGSNDIKPLTPTEATHQRFDAAEARWCRNCNGGTGVIVLTKGIGPDNDKRIYCPYCENEVSAPPVHWDEPDDEDFSSRIEEEY